MRQSLNMNLRTALLNRIALNAEVGSKYKEFLHPRLHGKWRSKGMVKPSQQHMISPGAPGAPIKTSKPGAAPHGQPGHISPRPDVAPGEATSQSEIKRLLAKQSYKPMSKEKERIATNSENAIAKAINGTVSGDNLAFDVVNGSSQVVEVKTIIDGKNPKITMHPASVSRKRTYIRKNKVRSFTVAVDVRGGEGAEVYYVRKGIGSFRLKNMTKVGSLQDLGKFIASHAVKKGASV